MNELRKARARNAWKPVGSTSGLSDGCCVAQIGSCYFSDKQERSHPALLCGRTEELRIQHFGTRAKDLVGGSARGRTFCDAPQPAPGHMLRMRNGAAQPHACQASVNSSSFLRDDYQTGLRLRREFPRGTGGDQAKEQADYQAAFQPVPRGRALIPLGFSNVDRKRKNFAART